MIGFSMQQGRAYCLEKDLLRAD